MLEQFADDATFESVSNTGGAVRTNSKKELRAWHPRARNIIPKGGKLPWGG